MIPNKLYKKIVESVPIVCVDVILKYEGWYILVKRVNEPLKGKWWLIGGRALKGEKTIDTAKRKIKEEIGLEVKNIRRTGIYEDSYPKSSWGIPTSSVSIVYTADVVRGFMKIDKTSSSANLFRKLPTRFLKHYAKP